MSDGEEETRDFIQEFVAHSYLNAQKGAAHSWSVPAVVTVCFNFPSAYTDYDNGVGKGVSNGGIMPTIKSDSGPHENRLQVLRC